MKLFTVGPTQMKKEIMEVGGQLVPYFRTKEFSNVMLDSDRLLQKFMHAPKGAKSIYLTASGTAAMEAVVMNCLNSRDKVLVIDGGTFGHRFVQLCDIHEVPYERVTLAADEKLTEEHLKPFDNIGITALLVNIDETSTGQLYDIQLLSDFCKRNSSYFVVDAISSYLIDSYDMEKYGIDATIISSQKGLCIAPGLSVVVLSERLIKDRVENNQIRNLYFDFNDYLRNFQRGQTPFTPCVGICMEMNKALHLIDEQGEDDFLGYIDAVAKDFREKVKKLPVSIPAFPLSNAVTPVIFDKPIAKKVFEILKDEYDIYVNPTGGEREPYVLRVAHIGDTTIEDNSMLIDCMEKAIKKVTEELE
ncbi:MAG: aminotransferase class V-fold PLP-dependent enzyme [Selenomonadales bacterium]|nr:aminotransferase class V-fold PLP-dependent enzyme [Selenomonadales bacterium]